MCVFSSHSFWTSSSLDVPARVTQEEGHTGFLIHLLSAVCVCFLPIHSGHQVRWTYQPGSHRRKVTQDLSSTFFLRCVCVFSSHSFWTSMDVPAGVTQEEGRTGFLIHLLSAVRALIFLARRIQPFLSLVDREVEFCVLTI